MRTNSAYHRCLSTSPAPCMAQLHDLSQPFAIEMSHQSRLTQIVTAHILSVERHGCMRSDANTESLESQLCCGTPLVDTQCFHAGVAIEARSCALALGGMEPGTGSQSPRHDRVHSTLVGNALVQRCAASSRVALLFRTSSPVEKRCHKQILIKH